MTLRAPRLLEGAAVLVGSVLIGSLGLPLAVPPTPAAAAPTGTIVAAQKGVGIWEMTADGAGAHVLLQDPGAVSVAAAPGGGYVAYGDAGSSKLTIATGGVEEASVVSGLQGSVTSIVWSPDAQRVAYSVCPGGGAVCQVLVANFDGSGLTPVVMPFGVDPDGGLSWTASGLLVAVSFTAASGCSGCPDAMFALDPSGITAGQPATGSVYPAAAPSLAQAAASIRGEVAYVGGPAGQPGQLTVFRGTASPDVRVPGPYTHPAWSPDGSTLIFTNGYQVLEDRPDLPGTPQAIATLPTYGLSSLSWVSSPGPGSGCSVALPAGSVQGIAASPDGGGYWVTDAYGGVSACGDAGDYGGSAGVHLNQPVLGIAPTSDGGGYWLVAYDGGVFTFGDAAPEPQNGVGGSPVSLGGHKLGAPIWAIVPTNSGHGYWLVGTDGGVFCFGDASFYGSAVPFRPGSPVVGMAATPTGHGYWLVTSGGAVYAFGDARPVIPLVRPSGAAPIVGMAADAAIPGSFWLVASDGTVYSLGGARVLGSAAVRTHVRGMTALPDGSGYWLVDADGTVFPFGKAPRLGDAH